MNKKGFTLIELLAVIVVLAIIALIATPIVMRLISDAQEGANARSVEGYMKAYEAKYYDYMLHNGGRKPSNDFQIATSDYSGAEVKCDDIDVVNGKFTAVCSVVGHDGTYKYENGHATKIGNGSVEGSTPSSPSSPNQPSVPVPPVEPVLPFPNNVTIPEGKVCVLTDGIEKLVGAQYVCNLGDGNRVFYILENNQDGDNISLIMNDNYDRRTPLSLFEATDRAADIKSNWTNSKVIDITLPTAQQIATAGGDVNWTDANATEYDLPEWLQENLSSNGISALEGYWTSTESADNSDHAWYVYMGRLMTIGKWDNRFIGFRPVIIVNRNDI